MSRRPQAPKKIMLVEPSASGHRMALYLRNVVKGMVEAGIQVSLLTSRRAITDPAYQLVELELAETSRIHFFETTQRSEKPNAVRLALNQVNDWFKLRQAVRNLKVDDRPDVVYIPTADWVAKAMEVFGSPFDDLPFVALYMSPKHHRFKSGIGPKSRSDVLYDWLFRRFLRISTLQEVLVVDEIFYEFAINQYESLSEKIRFAPDFAVMSGRIPKERARTKLGIPMSKTVILVYGTLTPRKGIQELLDALAEYDAPEGMSVLLAGRPSEQIKDLINQAECQSLVREGRLFRQFQFHDVVEECEVFSAADVVWIAYVQDFCGSSGVLHQAASYRLPVIAGTNGLIGKLVSEFKLGIIVNPRNHAALVSALNELSQAGLSSLGLGEQSESFRRKYSATAHFDAVASALNIPSEAPKT